MALNPYFRSTDSSTSVTLARDSTEITTPFRNYVLGDVDVSTIDISTDSTLSTTITSSAELPTGWSKTDTTSGSVLQRSTNTAESPSTYLGGVSVSGDAVTDASTLRISLGSDVITTFTIEEIYALCGKTQEFIDNMTVTNTAAAAGKLASTYDLPQWIFSYKHSVTSTGKCIYISILYEFTVDPGPPAGFSIYDTTYVDLIRVVQADDGSITANIFKTLDYDSGDDTLFFRLLGMSDTRVIVTESGTSTLHTLDATTGAITTSEVLLTSATGGIQGASRGHDSACLMHRASGDSTPIYTLYRAGVITTVAVSTGAGTLPQGCVPYGDTAHGYAFMTGSQTATHYLVIIDGSTDTPTHVSHQIATSFAYATDTPYYNVPRFTVVGTKIYFVNTGFDTIYAIDAAAVTPDLETIATVQAGETRLFAWASILDAAGSRLLLSSSDTNPMNFPEDGEFKTAVATINDSNELVFDDTNPTVPSTLATAAVYGAGSHSSLGSFGAVFLSRNTIGIYTTGTSNTVERTLERADEEVAGEAVTLSTPTATPDDDSSSWPDWATYVLSALAAIVFAYVAYLAYSAWARN